jgi:hypothetical protein
MLSGCAVEPVKKGKMSDFISSTGKRVNGQ